MKKNSSTKIIFWIDAALIHFGIAKYLQDNFECDLYSIIDITNKPKNFFEKQQIVKFQKTWYYHDYFKNLEKPDLNYLSIFEKKYNLNLWEMLSNDRIFIKYNENYKFTENEILSILEKECKLFESILDEIKPDFLIIHETALRHQHLFHQMCKIRGVKTLMLNFANFGQRSYISQEFHRLDYLENLENLKNNHRSFNDLENLLKSDKASKRIMNYYNKYRHSKIDKLKAASYFLFKPDINAKSHYSYYGRTKIGVLIKEIIYSLKTMYRESFVNKNLSFDIDTKEHFIFFPLHQEPERSLLISSPFINDQIEVIKLISKSLPIDYKLYVKEHPTQGKGRGWRPISIYKKMMEIPNVRLIHPSVDSHKIFPQCALVTSISGTSCFEAAFYQKPSIVFSNEGFTILPSIYQIKSPEELPNMIKSALETNVKVSDLDKYVTFLEENSFTFDYPDLEASYHNWFYFGGNLVDVEISIEKMESFLKEKKIAFEQLAFEHIKKIKQHKEHD